MLDERYCRALRADERIFLTGTAPVNPYGTVHTPGEGDTQAIRCFEIMQAAIHQLGSDFEHVTRTRAYVTDISRWKEFGAVHAEIFADHPPTTTMVEVRALIHPDLLIEIEADAIAPTPSA